MLFRSVRPAPFIPLACLAAVLCLLLACSRGGIEHEGKTHTRYRLVVVDSIGVEIGDTAFVFGTVAHSGQGDGGAVVLDRVSRTVRRFSPDGIHLETLSLGGSGPGEFGDPLGVLPLPGGGYAIYSPFDRKLSVFSLEEGYVREMVNTAGVLMGPMEAAALNDSSFVCRFYRFQEDSVSGILSVHSLQSDSVFGLAGKTVPFSEGASWHEGAAFMFATCHDGTVYVSEYSFDSFRIERFSGTGEIIAVLERKHAPVLKTPEEIQEETDVFRRRFLHAHGMVPAPDYAAEPYHYAISALSVDRNGRLWVQRREEGGVHYEVYDQDGSFLFRCDWEPPVWQDADGWSITIDRFGFLASPVNPEMYPLVYLLEPRQY